jgi:hypothetical protein
VRFLIREAARLILTICHVIDFDVIDVIDYDLARGAVVPHHHFSVFRPLRWLSAISESDVAVPWGSSDMYHVHLRSHHGREKGPQPPAQKRRGKIRRYVDERTPQYGRTAVRNEASP